MIGRFDRYLLAQLLMLFGFFALVLVLVYWVNRAVVLFDQLIANGQSALVFLEFSALTLPNVIRIVLPIAAFAGTLYVTNKLTSESELVVVQATGFSPWRLARPVLFFGVIVFCLASILAHVLVPASLRQLDQRTAEISENLTARLLTEGRFLHPARGITFYIREISPLGELQNVFLSDSRFDGRRVTYTAREALLIRGDTGPSLIMFEGLAQVYQEDGRRLSITRFEDFAYDLSGLVDIGATAQLRPQQLGTAQLLRADATTQALTGASRATLVAEAHERIGNALNGMIAPLIGFATLLLGGFSRFGIWRQIVGAIVLLIGVQMLTRVGQDMVQGSADLWPAAYLGPAFGAVLAIALLFLAARPALLRRPRWRRPIPAGGAQ
ncbi:LPS export ABC transporter permease LptF [Alphaproteobacteria bacterium GH1-50]|uniref:LPS export ABC transporter permease LptF n=1 Tax=Kangsaoukella pontilimi TaxID=2691042 RepID=A0A7C9MZJ4_9RHOB|nr:LPS export ABC transporter permease LptF [Kangsaoukella pontilimi]MXQ07538.1 LPS export ABC transporter permease LptF [Kangsaoukella pontilimi]